MIDVLAADILLDFDERLAIGKGETVHLPNSMPMEAAMLLASGGLEVPEKIFTITNQSNGF